MLFDYPFFDSLQELALHANQKGHITQAKIFNKILQKEKFDLSGWLRHFVFNYQDGIVFGVQPVFCHKLTSKNKMPRDPVMLKLMLDKIDTCKIMVSISSRLESDDPASAYIYAERFKDYWFVHEIFNHLLERDERSGHVYDLTTLNSVREAHSLKAFAIIQEYKSKEFDSKEQLGKIIEKTMRCLKLRSYTASEYMDIFYEKYNSHDWNIVDISKRWIPARVRYINDFSHKTYRPESRKDRFNHNNKLAK